MDSAQQKGSVLGNIGWPAIWGGAACAVFYTLVHQQLLQHELIERYFANHPVQYFEMALFCVGLAAVVLRTTAVLADTQAIRELDFAASDASHQSIGDAEAMVRSIAELPQRIQRSMLVGRVAQALQFVIRKGDASGLDAELKRLSEADADRQYEQNALVRIIIWATPMLGFLGTVIGITLALSDLSPTALVSTPESAMEGLLAGLAVAFDTTALALVLAIVLMFCQYVSNQFESQLLDRVDAKTSAVMVGRFSEFEAKQDPNVVLIRTMIGEVIESNEELIKRQAGIWERSISDAQKRWNRIADNTAEHTESAMRDAVATTLSDHAQQLQNSGTAMSALADKHWEQLQQALTENARLIQLQQSEMAKQSDAMLKLMKAAPSKAETDEEAEAFTVPLYQDHLRSRAA